MGKGRGSRPNEHAIRKGKGSSRVSKTKQNWIPSSVFRTEGKEGEGDQPRRAKKGKGLKHS